MLMMTLFVLTMQWFCRLTLVHCLHECICCFLLGIQCWLLIFYNLLSEIWWHVEILNFVENFEMLNVVES
jgi:hypothetical protein